MAKDVLITPANGDIQFKNASSVDSGRIQQDGDNLVISNAVGDVLLGDGSSDVYVGDGVNNVDIIFEQNGSIRGETAAGVTLTLGSADTALCLQGSSITSDNITGTASYATNADCLDGCTSACFYLASNPSGYTTCTGDITGVTAGVGLSGGGASGDVTLTVDLSELTDMTAAMVGTDEFIVLDASADRRKAANEIGLSIFNNDAGFTTCTGDITGVTAGVGLSGGGTSGGVTLDLDFSELTDMTGDIASGTEFILQNGTTESRKAASEIKLSVLNNDSGWTSCTGTVTSVATSGNVNGITLTGTVTTSGTLTLGGTLGNITVSQLSAAAVQTSGEAFSDSDTVLMTAAAVNDRIESFGYTTCTGDITGVTAGVGLSGGGTSGGVTLAVDLSELTDMTSAMVGTDEFIVLDASADRRKAANEIGLSIFNNDSGFTTCTGTVTSVGTTGTVNGITLTGTVTTSGTLTLGGSLSGITVSQLSAAAVQTSAEGFSDSDTVLMTAAAVNDRIESFGYTTCVGDITGVTAGVGLSGGGTSGTVTLALDFSELTDMTGDISGTTEFILQNGTTESRKAASEIKLSAFNNDSGWTSCTGDITGVTAGVGLTGGGASGAVTLTLGLAEVSSGTIVSASGVSAAGDTVNTKLSDINLSSFNNDSGFTTCTGDITGVTAGVGLSGGGSSGAVTLDLDFSELTDMTGDIASGTEFILQNGTTESRKAASEIKLSVLNNDSGWTSCTGTVTSVATTGNVNGITLTGTVTTSGTLTLGGTLGNITVSQLAAAAVQTSGEGFSDSDTVLMTAAAIDDRILSYGYTTCTGDILGVTAGTGLSGGGTSGTVTLNLDFSELTDMTGDISGTTEFILQNGTTESRKAASEIKLSNFNNDSGWTSCTGDITGVTAGTGLSGGGASGAVTLDLALSEISSGTIVSASGVSAAGDTVNTKLSDINLSSFNNDSGFTTCTGTVTMTNGSSTRIVTSTSATGLNGESDLTFSSGYLCNNNTYGVIQSSCIAAVGATPALYTQKNSSGCIYLYSDEYCTCLNYHRTGHGFQINKASSGLAFYVDPSSSPTVTINAASPQSQTLYVGGTVCITDDLDVASNTLFVDQSTGLVGIGTNSPSRTLHVCNPTGNAQGVFERGASGTEGWLAFWGGNGVGNIYTLAGDRLRLGVADNTGGTNLVEKLTINGSGNLIINESGNDQDLRVETSGNSNMLFVDGGNDRVGIGTSSPDQIFHVDGGANPAWGIFEKTSGTTGYLVFFGGTNQAALFHKRGGRLRFMSTTATNASELKDIFEIDASDNFVVNEGGDSAIDFRVESDTNTHMIFVDASTDEVGIGTSTPGSRLDIKSSAADNTGALRITDHDSSAWWSQYIDSSDNLLFLYCSLSHGGYLDPAANVGAIDFTGQHRSVTSDTFTTGSCSSIVGLIAVSDGTYCNFDGSTNASINEALPSIKLSDTPNDKRVFGVISDKEDISEGRTYAMGTFVSLFPTGSNEAERFIINSVGEGGMWVSNYNGNLENGDYITTSPLLGLGMKQDDDLLHNYTVAKITQDEDFTTNYEEVDYNGQTFKKAFVGVTYHSG